jgi:hypothetical protein
MSTAVEPKAQHYIPNFYLNGFTDTSRVLWVYEKFKPLRASKPKNEATSPTITPLRASKPKNEATSPTITRNIKRRPLLRYVVSVQITTYRKGAPYESRKVYRHGRSPGYVQRKAGAFSGSQPHQGKSQNLVAGIVGRKETESRESIDKAIFRMVSESAGRNESERTGGLENVHTRGRALLDGAKAA